MSRTRLAEALFAELCFALAAARRGVSIEKVVGRAALGAMIRRKAARCGRDLHVNGWSKVNASTSLGDNVNLNGLVVEGQGKVVIGDNFHSGPGCLIITQTHNYDTGEAIPYDGTYRIGDVVIEDNVWLGSRVVVVGPVRIGEGAIVQAGSVVVRDVPALAIVGGHPAAIFKHRDREHYERLKQAGRFH